MEQQITSTSETIERNNTVKFIGKGSELFAIDLVNALLTIITLGLYYPWAKAKKLKYLYQNTLMKESEFDFLGTGKEIFRGYIKAILIMAGFYALYITSNFLLRTHGQDELFIGIFIATMLLLTLVGIPIFSAYAIFGTFRYRAARSTWRGILCGFEAEKRKFIKSFLGAYYLLFSTYILFIIIIFTSEYLQKANGMEFSFAPILVSSFSLPLMLLMIYLTAYYKNNIYSITYGNLRLGSLKLNYKGKTSNLFGIYFGNGFLVSITFGVYYFWYKKNLYNFLIENLHLKHNEEEHKVKSSITAGQVFKLEVGNILLLLFTLGIAYSWTYCRTARFIARNIIIPENINLDKINQTEKAYTDATGEELSDIMDLGGIFF